MDYNGIATNAESTFPDPLASHEKKSSDSYGVKYAKAIFSEWGSLDSESSLYRRRFREFETSRDYANGTQDTSKYKELLSSLNPNNGDGSLLNIDWSPVPIIPKFLKIVVNKILSSSPYPQVEATDPLSKNEKDLEKNKVRVRIENKDFIAQAKALGIEVDTDPDKLPQTEEELEIFLETNIKTDAEIAAQIATQMTLSWNDYDEKVHRRCVEDLVTCGMSVVKRNNDPNYGIVTEYVDPARFIHSFTEDPNLSDIVYAGHIKRMSIAELKRVAGNKFTEEEYEKMAKTVRNKYSNNPNRFNDSRYDSGLDTYHYGYDEYTIEVLDFEFMSVDSMIFEKKQSRYGNIGFYYKGEIYKPQANSVYDREPVYMYNATVYGGKFIIGCDKIFDYGPKKNVPKNVHDLTKTRLSYSPIAVNMRRMIPKSLVSGITTFADQIQISHLKIQQAVAKAKPDGLVIDIEGLENVQLGMGGELQPLEIQDIYEQTGVFYYRSRNPEGGFQNPPVREINNAIRNIEQLIGHYNHYLNMIRDTTGINEVMDGSSPKGEQLVGVRQQAIAAGNNAIYDITNASLVLYRKVCEDIIKCLQILPPKSIIYQAYERAIGKANMDVITSFRELPMYNFGVRVIKEMNDNDRAYLEQNIQIALGQKEIDLEDAIAIRQLKDIDQAERLLVIRRKQRIKKQQEQQMQNIQAQSEANQQAAQSASQAKMQEQQVLSQLEMQKLQFEAQLKAQMLELEYKLKSDLETVKGQYDIYSAQASLDSSKSVEQMKEDRKDDRVKKQAVEQSKLISQRQGQRGELEEPEEEGGLSELLS
jgi:hypothetical protein